MAVRNFLLLAALGNLGSVLAAPSAPITIMGAQPGYPASPDSTPYCTWWWDNDGSIPCELMAEAWEITWDDFVRWNPSLVAGCDAYKTSMSYCVAASGEPPVVSTAKPTTSSSTTSSSTSSTVQTTGVTSTSTTTSLTTPPPITATTATTGATQTVGPNGIATPLPIQRGMVSNCNKFVKVNPGDSCDLVTFFNGPIATEDFVLWNSGVGGMQCSSLQAGTYACVGVTGTTTTTSSTPTATVGPNGISTPLPIQLGMVTNCNKFYMVKSGETCDHVAFWGGAPGTGSVIKWNPGVGPDCRTLQAGTYACVGIIGGTPTNPGNGVSTPTPTHPGMVSNCNKFYKVNPGETCDHVAFWGGAPGTGSVIKWNTGVGPDCRTLQPHTYACVGVI